MSFVRDASAAAVRFSLMLAAFGIACALAPASAQPFFAAPWRAFETGDIPDGHFAVHLATADLNGDGLPDAVTAQNYFAPGLRVFLNRGATAGQPATFPDEGTFYPLANGSWHVEARDLDGDGDLDLLSTNTDFNYVGTTVVVLRNHGDGTFAAPQSFPAGGPSTGVTAGDFDGDGDLDAAVANYGSFGLGSTVSILRNNGNGTFAAPVTIAVAAGPNDIEAGDLDGDGDLDLAVAHAASGGRVSVLRNTGTGTFAAPVVYQNLFPGTGQPQLALADPDGDGDLDIATVGSYNASANEARLVLLRNDGSGAFTPQLISYGHPYEDSGHEIVAADLDGDSRDDLVVADHFDAGLYVFLDDDATSLRPAQRYATVPNPIGLGAADLDGDGDDDVLATSRIQRLLAAHENVGSGVLPERPIYGSGNGHTVLDLGDVDGDGDLDAVASHGGAASSHITVYANDGSGAYAQSQQLNGGYGFAKLRDLTGDGVLDLLFVSAPTAPPYDFFVARGTGNGSFQPPVRWPVDACGIGHPNAVDLDADGDLDVVNTEDKGCIGGGDGGRRLFISLNNGNGTFQPPTITFAGVFPYNTVAGDFNEDGHLDLATSSQSISAIVFGNGDGTFGPEQTLPAGELGANLLALDLNEDGHLDLATLASTAGASTAESVLVTLLGNGTGAFAETRYSEHLLQDGREWLATGDVNGDGHADLLAGGAGDALVFLGSGTGALAFSGRYGVGRDAWSLHYADVTGDGRGDLVTLNGQETPAFGGEYGLAVVVGLDGAVTASDPTVPATSDAGALAVAPNPADASAALTLALPESGRALVAVYDALGRRVAVLHDGPLAAGTHTLTLEAAALPAGVYVVHATAAGASLSRRLTIVH